MAETVLVRGIYKNLDQFHETLSRVDDRGFHIEEVYSPIPTEPVEQVYQVGPSRVRFFTLIGASLGAGGGFTLAAWSSVKWGLITGGKPIVSVPPFLVVGFVFALLVGALATVSGLLSLSGLFGYRDPLYDDRFSNDHFGIVISGTELEQEEIIAFLHRQGATEVLAQAREVQ